MWEIFTSFVLSLLIYKSDIETAVEKVISKAVIPAHSEDLINPEQVVAIFTELVQEEVGLEGEGSTTLGGGWEGGYGKWGG